VPSPATAPAAAPTGLKVAVRTLCAFGARSGDLSQRFTPAPSGAQGVAGHGEVTSRRGPDYQRELALSARHGDLWVMGRADGFDAAARRLEEIKTHRGELALVPANQRSLHWAQAKVYGAMLCEQLGWERIELALVYFNIDSATETVLAEWHEREALQAFFSGLCERYSAWAAAERAHRERRDAALSTLAFPFAGFRAGQRELAAAVYRAQGRGQTLLAQAPTGIGKTMATLFGALKAAPGQGLDKVFYLTAKTTGRQLALDALQRLGAGAGLPLRVLERVARDKACEHPDKACDGASCPLAQGFFDRLPAAREACAHSGWLDKARLRETALAHGICPYYLGQEMQRWCDVLVGDYNHYFDHGAHWHTLALEQEWRVGLLVDEAHNLIERARQMHSAALDPVAFQALRKGAAAPVKKTLNTLQRRWSALAKAHPGEHVALAGLPDELLACLQGVSADLMAQLAQLGADAEHSPLMPWVFEAQQLLRVAEAFADHSVCDLTRAAGSGTAALPAFNIRNLVPGPLLEPRWQSAHSATLFSATLSPVGHVQHMLGLPGDSQALDLPSPFAAEQLRVRIAPHISTRFKDRADSLDDLVRVMATQYAERPGNYLAFFSSFDYLQQAQQRLQALAPDVEVWAQSRGMGESSRDAFIARFEPSGRGIGFAVLGGAFGEGLDLPGERLVGAFIATLGLPQVNAVNEQMRTHLQRLNGQGYDSTYTFPGLMKVVQAAGRVIRSESDRGTLWLLDDRFARSEVRRLLPAWWRVELN
jgi:DNA excision repair protein ERCC-2